MSAPLRIERVGRVLWLTLDRPARRNALDASLVEALLAALSAPPPGVRVVLLRGSGGHLCAGGDVAEMAGADEARLAVLNRRFGALLEAIAGCAVPVVTVCEGVCFGGGVGLASAADLTVASTTARFRLPELRLGVVPAQILPFVARRVGVSGARRLALTSPELDANEALRVGLVDARVEPDALDAHVRDLVEALTAAEPGALQATRAFVRELFPPVDPSVLDRASVLFARYAVGPAARAGFAAQRAGEAPPWTRE
jgi:isohexenylglutaconyl-CoA hydratase